MNLTLNQSEAFASANNIKNFTYDYNFSNNSAFNNMLNVSTEGNFTTDMISSFFTPITHFWASNAVMGSWFYVVILIFTVGMVYIKTKSLESTSITMLMLSLVVAAPATTGTFVMPATVLNLLYVAIVLSLAGVLIGLFTDG